MLLSFSPQGTFVLILFELVLSGLSLVVLVWILFREPQQESRAGLSALSVGFALLVTAFALRAVYCRLAVCPPASMELSYSWLLFASEAARVLGAGSLVAGYLIKQRRPRWAAVLGAATLGLVVFAVARYSSDAPSGLQSIVPLTTNRLAEVVVLVVGMALVARAQGIRLAAALILLAAGRAVAVMSVWRPESTELAWASEHVATLAGLIVFALALERESRQTTLRFLVRLNLTFIVLASSLILAVTEIERRQFVEFSAMNAQDLAEFVRGHMLYYSNRGEQPTDVLSHDDVIRKLVAEFGRYPDLRRVQVSLRGRTMALSINQHGEIDQQFWIGERDVRPRVSPADFSAAPLMSLPILAVGQSIGRVELDHSLERINERIGWQMQLIFAIFTLFVSVASLVTGMLVVGADRTIRRQYEELERTRRRLSLTERLASIGAVADGVAHEINNPAGILVARTDYLLSVIRQSPVFAEIRDDLETIRRQAQRIAKTVKDLLTFTRPSHLCGEVFDVHAVLESALALVRPLASGRKVVLECRLGAETPLVCGDPDRLEQVLTNLLTNAVHAIPGEGRITLATSSCADGGVEIVVQDTGIGIPSEHVDRVFDPFFTTRKPGSGTGLGLSIAYGIVRDHGGTIDVTSVPGAGTEFRVTLPPATVCRDSHASEAMAAKLNEPGTPPRDAAGREPTDV